MLLVSDGSMWMSCRIGSAADGPDVRVAGLCDVTFPETGKPMADR